MRPYALALLAGLAFAGQAAVRRDLPAGARRERFLEIMIRGSLNVSRTKVVGRRFMAASGLEDVSRLAREDFEDAAAYVVDHAAELPLSSATAVDLNRRLTRGLVPRPYSGSVVRSAAEARAFFAWLASPAAVALGNSDPVALAGRIHDRVSSMDEFPDGNGRTARLFADLALLKHGRPPAFYTDIEDYFSRGSSRSPVTPEHRLAYFREMCRRGELAAEHGVDFVAAADREPSWSFLHGLRGQNGQKTVDGNPW